MMATLLSACGQKVEVPPAHVGKIMTKVGYDEEVITTRKFRLPFCVFYCDRLILLSVADQSVNEKMDLLMPKDRLNMEFDLRMTLSVRPDAVTDLFNKIAPNEAGYIDWNRIYNTYAQQIVRSEAREFLSEFSIDEVMSNRETINQRLSERLSRSILANTPFSVRYAGLADIKFPDVIVQAQQNAAERRERIQQEEAQLQVSKVELERQLQETRLQRAIDIERAEAEAEVNRILAQSVTPQYIRYRELNALERLSDPANTNKVFVPVGALNSIAGQNIIGRQ